MLEQANSVVTWLCPDEPNPFSYHPEMFAIDDPVGRVRLHQLITATPGITIHDTLDLQLRELIKTRHPGQRFNLDELTQQMPAYLDGVAATHYGVWVYYPWSRRLVHVLPEAEFIELRTNRNHYKITPEEHRTLATKKVGVIGLSVGQSAALTMAMERSFGEIRLADFDTLDLSNLNRLRSGIHNLALPKVVIAAREIAEIDPFLSIKCYLEGINETNLDSFLLEGGSLNVLVEEADAMDIKFLARYRARALGIPVVMDTSDRGLLDVERFDREPERSLFHGLVDELDVQQLKGLTTEEKIPIILKLVGVETLSKRMKASMIEVEQSLYTWPQLASNVVLGGALAADVVRRILLNQYHSSGRYFVDLEELVRDPESPVTAQEQPDTVIALTQATIDAAVKSCLQGDYSPLTNVGLTAQQVDELVAAGIQAPSGGNCQPWRWLYQQQRLFLFHDEQRSASFLDFENCASYAALGAATENVILKAHQLGLAVQVQPFPNPDDKRLVAVFGFSSSTLPTSEPHVCDALVDIIELRTTNRRLGLRQPIAPAALRAIRQAAETLPGATVHVIADDGSLGEAARMLGAVERLRLLHQPSHHDLMREIRWTQEAAQQSRDGIDLQTLALSAVDRAALNVCRDWTALALVSAWGRGAALAKPTRKAVDAAACLVLITMPDPTPHSYLLGGRALQRAWLTANQHAIAFQPLSSIPYLFARLIRGGGSGMNPLMLAELSALRRSYLDLFNIEEGLGEILLFRLAVADAPTTQALRRPVTEVLVPSAEV